MIASRILALGLLGIGLLVWAFGGVAEAAPCDPDRARAADGSAARRNCPPPPRKFEPYDPDRVRAGKTPGFIDLGNGTEIRVGGRARVDYDMRR